MWRAYFQNGFVIDEFSYDDTGKVTHERGFNHVLDRHDILEKLSIILDNGDVFTLDITKGLFSVNKKDQGVVNFFGLPQDKCAQETLSNVRIIYFTHETIHMKVRSSLNDIIGVQKPVVQFTALGFQALTPDGRNIQRYLAVYPDGLFDLRGEKD